MPAGTKRAQSRSARSLATSSSSARTPTDSPTCTAWYDVCSTASWIAAWVNAISSTAPTTSRMRSASSRVAPAISSNFATAPAASASRVRLLVKRPDAACSEMPIDSTLPATSSTTSRVLSASVPTACAWKPRPASPARRLDAGVQGDEADLLGDADDVGHRRAHALGVALERRELLGEGIGRASERDGRGGRGAGGRDDPVDVQPEPVRGVRELVRDAGEAAAAGGALGLAEGGGERAVRRLGVPREGDVRVQAAGEGREGGHLGRGRRLGLFGGTTAPPVSTGAGAT